MDSKALLIEVFLKNSHFQGKSVHCLQFTTFGVLFLHNTELYLATFPLSGEDVVVSSICLASSILTFCVVEGDTTFCCLLTVSSELSLCSLQEDSTFEDGHRIGPKSYGLFHLSANPFELPGGFSAPPDLDMVEVAYDPHLSIASIKQSSFLSLIAAQVNQETGEVIYEGIVLNLDLEGDLMRKLAPSSREQLYSFWTSSAGTRHLINKAGFSSLQFLPIHGSPDYYDCLRDPRHIKAVSTSHKSMITAISHTVGGACDYALTGDIQGGIALWKASTAIATTADYVDAAVIAAADSKSPQRKDNKPWQIVLENRSLCENQRITLLQIEATSLYVYIGDTSGRITVLQVSARSNQLHMLHELSMFPLLHGPSHLHVQLIPSNVSALSNDPQQQPRKLSADRIVRCYSDSCREAVQCVLSNGMSSLLRVSTHDFVPHGLTTSFSPVTSSGLPSDHPEANRVLRTEHVFVQGSGVVDCSVVLSSVGLIAVADWTGSLHLWDIALGTRVGSYALPMPHVVALCVNDGLCWERDRSLCFVSGHRGGEVHAVTLRLAAGRDHRSHNSQGRTTATSSGSGTGKSSRRKRTGDQQDEDDVAVFDLLQEDHDSDSESDSDDDDDNDDENDSGGDHDTEAEDTEHAIQRRRRYGIDGGDLQTRQQSRKKRESRNGSLSGSLLSQSNDVDSVRARSLTQVTLQRQNSAASSLLQNVVSAAAASSASHSSVDGADALSWEVTQRLQPCALVVSDVFLSDRGHCLVSVHARQFMYLYPRDVGTATAVFGGIAEDGSVTVADTNDDVTAANTDPVVNTTATNSYNDSSNNNNNNSAILTQTRRRKAKLPPLKTLKLPDQVQHISVVQRQGSSSTEAAQEEARSAVTGSGSADEVEDRLWLVLQCQADVIVVLDALQMTYLTELPLSTRGQELQLHATLMWDYIDEVQRQRVLMGICARNLHEWLVFNEVDGLKAAWEAPSHVSQMQQANFSIEDSAGDVSPSFAAQPSPHLPPLPQQSQVSSSMISQNLSSMSILAPTATVLESTLIGVEPFGLRHAPVVVSWSWRCCLLLRLQMTGGNRLLVTRTKSYVVGSSAPTLVASASAAVVRSDSRADRVHVVTGKALISQPHVRNHRVVVVLSNGFAVVLNL